MIDGVRIEQHTGHPLAVVRRQGGLADLPRIVPEACGTVWRLVKARNIPNPGRHVAVYLDDVMNLEIGAEVPAPITGDDELIASATPAGRVATVTHFGPYQGLKHAHEAIHRWAEREGHTLVRPCWEVYGHWDAAWDRDPTLIRTDVSYLLK